MAIDFRNQKHVSGKKHEEISDKPGSSTSAAVNWSYTMWHGWRPSMVREVMGN
jgi:hypothetical protein